MLTNFGIVEKFVKVSALSFLFFKIKFLKIYNHIFVSRKFKG
jgi:hypothetical protein